MSHPQFLLFPGLLYHNIIFRYLRFYILSDLIAIKSSSTFKTFSHLNDSIFLTSAPDVWLKSRLLLFKSWKFNDEMRTLTARRQLNGAGCTDNSETSLVFIYISNNSPGYIYVMNFSSYQGLEYVAQIKQPCRSVVQLMNFQKGTWIWSYFFCYI